MRFSVFILIIVLAHSCQQREPKENEVQSSEHKGKHVSNSPEFTVIAVEYPESGWGYQILQDGKLAIDQKHIPVIQGYKGFSTKVNAEKTANYIVDKLERGIFPPTLTIEELDSLDVL